MLVAPGHPSVTSLRLLCSYPACLLVGSEPTQLLLACGLCTGSSRLEWSSSRAEAPSSSCGLSALSFSKEGGPRGPANPI